MAEACVQGICATCWRLKAPTVIPLPTNELPGAPMIIRPNDTAIGDFNSDGIMDVTIPTFAYSYLIQSSPAGGLPTPSMKMAHTREESGVAVGFLNSDDKLDVIMHSPHAGALYRWIGNGTGNFSVQPEIPLNPIPKSDEILRVSAISSGDLNDDGRLDIAILAGYLNATDVLPNRWVRGVLFGEQASTDLGQLSTPVYTDLKYETGTEILAPSFISMDLQIADLDNDTYLDVAILVHQTQRGNQIQIYYGNASASAADGLSAVPQVVQLIGDGGPDSLAIGDLNGDGQKDVVAARCDSSAPIDVVLTGKVKELPSVLSPLAVNPSTSERKSVCLNDIKLVDVDGDKHLDIIALSGRENRVYILRGNGDGSFAEPSMSPVADNPLAAPESIEVGDVTGDHLADVVAANRDDESFSVLQGELRPECSSPSAANP